MSTFFALLALCLCGSAMAQVPGLGQCPRVENQKPFDMSRYAGNWYVIARYFTLFELRSKCNYVDFSPKEDGTMEGVKKFISGFTGNERTVVANFQPEYEGSGKMSTHLPLTPFNQTSDCYYSQTDYESYSVIYCCTNYKYSHLKWAWLLTRTPAPTRSVVTKAYRAIEGSNVEKRLFWKSSQKGCNYSPEYDSEYEQAPQHGSEYEQPPQHD